MKNKNVTTLLAVLLLFAACKKNSSDSTTDQLQDAGVGSTATAGSKLQVNAAPASGTLVDGAIYRIRAVSSLNNGPAVEVAGNSTADNAKIQQWSWFPNNGQKWILTKVDATYYKLVNLTSNKCLTSPSATAGDQLTQFTDNGSDSERWAISYTGFYNRFTLTNKATGLKMVIDHETGLAGEKLKQQSTFTGTQNLFQFTNMFYQNPLTTNSKPDPFVAQKDGYYYFLSTHGNNITLTKTPSMSTLNAYPEITVFTPPAGTDHSSNLWAPEMYFLSGKWYIYFTANDGVNANHRHFVLENANADPTVGTWTLKGKMTDATDKLAIDGSVLSLNGTNYFIWSGWQDDVSDHTQVLYIAQMSNPWTITGSRVKISTPTNDWERRQDNGAISQGVNEGPIALQRDATSHLFIIYTASRYTSDYYSLAQIMLVGSGNPLNPADWINKKQLFTTNAAQNVYGPGHNGFFISSYTDPNGTTIKENWLIYHARSTPNTPNGPRQSRMQKFTFNADGSPNFGTPVGPGTDMLVPIAD